MATCEPAPGQGSRGKPGRAAGLAGWGMRGSVDVTAEAVRGGKLFPRVTSPGLCANLGTQCYHCEPAHGQDGCARTGGPRRLSPGLTASGLDGSCLKYATAPFRGFVSSGTRTGCAHG